MMQDTDKARYIKRGDELCSNTHISNLIQTQSDVLWLYLFSKKRKMWKMAVTIGLFWQSGKDVPFSIIESKPWAGTS